jgi:membrane-associated phospholipid phosphatase
VVVVVMVGVGIVVGGAIALLASRWPVIAAPRVAPETVATGVQEHASLWRHLRRHYDPKSETGVALIAASAAVVLGAVAVGVLLTMVRENLGFARWDSSLARFGAEHATAWTTRVLKDVSLWFGSTLGVICFAVVVCVVEMIRKPSRALPLFLVVALGGQLLLSNLIKLLVDRARPDVLQLSHAVGSSFPSGHTTAAACSMAAFALLLGRDRSRRTKIALAGVAGGIAACVACSRVFLGVHWFTDVLAGLALGWGWFALSSIAFGGRLLRFGVPVEAGAVVAATTPTPVPERTDPTSTRS